MKVKMRQFFKKELIKILEILGLIKNSQECQTRNIGRKRN